MRCLYLMVSHITVLSNRLCTEDDDSLAFKLYCHNIQLSHTGHLQLTDFGLAKWLTRGEKTRTVCGTLQYMGKLP